MPRPQPLPSTTVITQRRCFCPNSCAMWRQHPLTTSRVYTDPGGLQETRQLPRGQLPWRPNLGRETSSPSERQDEEFPQQTFHSYLLQQNGWKSAKLMPNKHVRQLSPLCIFNILITTCKLLRGSPISKL